MNCGITGHTGALGQEFIKNNKNIKFIKFHGDLTNKKEVEFWVKKNTFNIFLHFAAVVPTKFVNENYVLILFCSVFISFLKSIWNSNRPAGLSGIDGKLLKSIPNSYLWFV